MHSLPPISFRCLNGKLQYLQHNCVGDTIVYHWYSDLCYCFRKRIFQNCHIPKNVNSVEYAHVVCTTIDRDHPSCDRMTELSNIFRNFPTIRRNMEIFVIICIRNFGWKYPYSYEMPSINNISKPYASARINAAFDIFPLEQYCFTSN